MNSGLWIRILQISKVLSGHCYLFLKKILNCYILKLDIAQQKYTTTIFYFWLFCTSWEYLFLELSLSFWILFLHSYLLLLS